MRRTVMIGLLMLGGCGGGEEKAKAPEAARALQAGQWEVSSEVAQFQTLDQGSPRINTPIGTKATEQSCVAAGETSQPQPALFTGEAYQCRWGDLYMRGGRINGDLDCRRGGLSPIDGTVSGTFTASEFDAEVSLSTRLVGDGDVSIVSRVRGRRAGECTSGAPSGEPKGG